MPKPNKNLDVNVKVSINKRFISDITVKDILRAEDDHTRFEVHRKDHCSFFSKW